MPVMLVDMWLSSECDSYRLVTRHHNTPAFISIINNLCVGPRSTGASHSNTAWRTSRLCMMSSHTELWPHPENCTRKLSCEVRPASHRPDKRPSCPHLSGITSPIKKLHFFVIGGVNIKLSDFPAQVNDCRGRKKNSTGVSLVSASERFSSDIGTIFYSILLLVGEKTQNSLLYIVTIVLPLIQKNFLFTFLCRTYSRNLETAPKLVCQYQHHQKKTHWVFVLQHPSHMDKVWSL